MMMGNWRARRKLGSCITTQSFHQKEQLDISCVKCGSRIKNKKDQNTFITWKHRHPIRGTKTKKKKLLKGVYLEASK